MVRFLYKQNNILEMCISLFFEVHLKAFVKEQFWIQEPENNLLGLTKIVYLFGLLANVGKDL